MHEGLEPELGDRGPDRPDIRERVLARQHHAGDAHLAHQPGPGFVVHRELRRAVDLEARVDLLDEANRAHVLHQRGVDPAVDALAQVEQRLAQLRRFEEHVEGEVDAGAARVRQAAGLLQVLEAQLCVVIARVEFLDAQVDRIGAVRDGRPNGVEAPGGGKELGHPTYFFTSTTGGPTSRRTAGTVFRYR